MGVEAKIYNGEKALIQVAQRGDTGMNFINESHERVEKRVMSLEANLLALGVSTALLVIERSAQRS